MKFRRMNQDTIKCVLSEQELKENGLDVYELLNNDDKTRVFMQGVFEAAQKEMGENSQGRFASLEVTLLPNRDVELTLSKSSEADIIKSLEHIRSIADGSIPGVTMERIEHIRRLHGAEQRAAYKEMLSIISKYMGQGEPETEPAQKTESLEGNFEREEALEDQENGQREKYNRFYSFELNAMKDVLKLSRILGNTELLHTGLYHMENGKYYFLIDAKGIRFHTVYKFLGTSLEFVDAIIIGGAKQAYIREHATCVIQDYAFQILHEL